MGLVHEQTLPSGIPVAYHRVVSLNVITNSQNVIEVASYTSKAKRQEEAAAASTARETGEYPQTDVFIETRYFNAPYDQEMTVGGAYAWLKGQPAFEGAQDDMEGGSHDD